MYRKICDVYAHAQASLLPRPTPCAEIFSTPTLPRRDNRNKKSVQDVLLT